MADDIRVLGICGSLRRASLNAGLLRAAVELAPAGVSVQTADLADIPLYNEDVREQGFPPAVAELRRQVGEADALLIVTPEYNYSIPGVLKNAIDWVSRPPEQPFDGKPLAIMGGSPGMGTVRAQYHLRQVCVFLNMLPLNKPEVMVGRAHEKFDADGKLTDAKTREVVAGLLTALASWTRRLRQTV
jgi:chromate reductase